ncbi:hypothetical protein TNCV_3644711 [Trichonephila clavipes]|nr:hypothetical protein TNCV_3644711 [Trichonephila clavipes]
MLLKSELRVNSQQNYLVAQYNQTQRCPLCTKHKTQETISSPYSPALAFLQAVFAILPRVCYSLTLTENSLNTKFSPAPSRSKIKGSSFPLTALFEGQPPSPPKKSRAVAQKSHIDMVGRVWCQLRCHLVTRLKFKITRSVANCLHVAFQLLIFTNAATAEQSQSLAWSELFLSNLGLRVLVPLK